MKHTLLPDWLRRGTALKPALWQSLIAVLLLLVLWQTTWMPAWRTWSHSEQTHQRLEQQLSDMRQMQQQLQQLQSQAPIAPQAAAQSLQTLASTLGKHTQVQQQAGQVQIQFKDVEPQQLAEFLSQAHQQSRARVLQANWQSTRGIWSGQIQFALPGAQ
jgi:type II secretory pathway component PulM